MRTRRLYLTLAGAAVALSSMAALASAQNLLDTTFAAGNFVPGAPIDNPYSPFIPGTRFVYTSESTGGCEVNLVEVTSNFKDDFPSPYDSVTALEVHDRVWADENCAGDYALTEDTADWYAQDKAGNLWYFGEATTSYAEDSCPSHEGSWQAGVDGADAGIVMLASPRPGVAYRQEFLEGTAEDLARVLRLNASVSIELGAFAGCLITKEWSPLELGVIEQKTYCPTAGGLVRVREHHGKTVQEELIGNTLPPGEYAPTGVCGP